MAIKPMYETGTIRLSTPVTHVRKLETKVVKDPGGTIPNGIYKVISWERIRQTLTLALSFTIMLASIILIILYALVYKTAAVGFVIPTLVLIASLWKASSTFLERNWLKRSVQRYREDLKIGISSTPPFISRMYLQLHKKQIAHNWLTFSLMFYGGIGTLLLWWLKDFSWWWLHFDKWINALFSNPTLMVWIFTASLIAVAVIHVMLSIQRKKRLLEIDSYFGSQMMPQSDIDSLKQTQNKMFRRIFIISVLVILIIPMVSLLILKVVRRKK